MNTLASLSNTSGAKNRPFVICCASATVELPTTEWLGDSKQHCSYLVPPTMDGSKVISTSDDLEKILVVDMGGLGRALEFLDRVLKEERGEYSLADLRGKVYSRLREEHPDWDEYSDVVREVLSAVIIWQSLPHLTFSTCGLIYNRAD